MLTVQAPCLPYRYGAYRTDKAITVYRYTVLTVYRCTVLTVYRYGDYRVQVRCLPYR